MIAEPGTKGPAREPGPGWLLGQLPAAMQRDKAIAILVTGLEQVANSVRREVNEIPEYFDIPSTSVEFVRWMGSWLDVVVEAENDTEANRDQRIRRTASVAGAAFRRRGTRQTLEELISAVTGETVTVIDPGGLFRAGETINSTVEVSMPDLGGISAPALVRLIEQETPIDLRIELSVAGEVIYQTITHPPGGSSING